MKEQINCSHTNCTKDNMENLYKLVHDNTLRDWRVERAGQCVVVTAETALQAVWKILIFAANDLKPIHYNTEPDGGIHVKIQNGYSFFCYDITVPRKCREV